MRVRVTFSLVVALSVLGTATVNFAAAPERIDYQGILLENGQKVATNTSVTFSIYDAHTGGTHLWTETRSVTPDIDGVFTIILGELNPIDDSVFSGSNRWLGIRIAAEPELTPRTQLAAAPYSFRVATIDGASGGTVADSLKVTGMIHSTSEGFMFPDSTVQITAGDGDITAVYAENGLTETATTGDVHLNVGAGDGINVTADRVAVSFADGGSASTVARSDHSHSHFADPVSFGDNTMVVCSSKVVIGSHSCDVSGNTSLLQIKRYIETDEGMFHAIDVNIDDEVSTSTARGVYSNVTSYNGAATGIYGKGIADGSGIGVEGRGLGGANAYGIVGHGLGASNNNYAGKFYDDVDIIGTLSKGGGSFRIDHPLDPENKYLQHSFVESADMMNIYNGNAILDSEGQAIVELPAYFEALNRDFRYQLTCIGGYAPVYISEEISGNRFTIAGGEPSMKVSWQVTGVRQDKWAEANRIQVEVEKRAVERGFYRHPELYGFVLEKHVDYDILKDKGEESGKE